MENKSVTFLSKLSNHHAEDFKRTFRVDGRIGLVLRFQYGTTPFVRRIAHQFVYIHLKVYEEKAQPGPKGSDLA